MRAGVSGEDDRRPAVLPSGGAWLRLLLALSCAAAFTVSWIPPTNAALGWLELLGAVVLTVWPVIRPGSAAVMVVIAAVFAVRIFHGQPVLDRQLVMLVVLVPLIHYLAALAAVIPLRSGVQWVVFLPTGLRYTGSVLLTPAVLLAARITGSVG